MASWRDIRGARCKRAMVGGSDARWTGPAKTGFRWRSDGAPRLCRLAGDAMRGDFCDLSKEASTGSAA